MAGASASAIKAGEAFVSLIINNDLFKKGLAQASADLKAWGKGLAAIGGAALGAGGALLAPITAGLADFLSYAGEVRGMATRLGETAENMSALGYAASTAGVDFEGLERSLKFFEKSMFEARGGNQEMAETLERLGVTDFGDSLTNNLLKAADGFKKLEDGVDRTGTAIKVMGRAGTEMIGFLSKGGGGIADLMGRAREIGAVLSTEDAAAAKKFSLSLKELEAAGRFAFMSLGQALIPAFGRIEEGRAKLTQMVISVRQWIQANSSLIIVAFAAGSALVAFGTAVAAAGAGLIATGAALSALGTIFGVLASPPGLVTAAVLGLAAALRSEEHTSELQS